MKAFSLLLQLLDNVCASFAAPRSIAAENISVLLAAESDALHIEIEVSRLSFNLTQLNNNFDLTYSSATYAPAEYQSSFSSL